MRLLLSSHDVDLAAFIPGLNTSRGDAISDEERDQLLALLGEADRQFVHRPEAEVELSDDDVDDDEYDDDVDDDDGSDCDRQEVGILDLHAEVRLSTRFGFHAVPRMGMAGKTRVSRRAASFCR